AGLDREARLAGWPEPPAPARGRDLPEARRRRPRVVEGKLPLGVYVLFLDPGPPGALDHVRAAARADRSRGRALHPRARHGPPRAAARHDDLLAELHGPRRAALGAHPPARRDQRDLLRAGSARRELA